MISVTCTFHNCCFFSVHLLSIHDHRWILLYVYIPLLETELADLKMAYNAHKIRKQKGKLRPDGVPDDMYYFPDPYLVSNRTLDT